MDKLLIVDDEYLVREGLKTTVDWQMLGLEVVGTCENGQIGLEMARKLKPDLIIVDVRMPVLDGLQMAEKLFEEKADLAIIAYSGYKDFENARKALHIGVAGFLCKPIQSEELISKVKSVMKNLHDKRRNNSILSQFISNLPIVRRKQFELLISDFSKQEEAKEQLSNIGVTISDSGTLIYIKSSDSYIETFINDVKTSLSTYVNGWEIMPDETVFFTSSDLGFVKEEIQKILDKSLSLTDSRFCVVLVNYNNDYKQAYDKAVELSKNTLFNLINCVITENDNGHLKKIVRDALQIIQTDYNKRISIKKVAEALYTSESHFMHVFKDQVGKTFNECLTDFRMLKAQELLLKGGLRIGEVAYEVGYSDVKYFGQVFRDYTGYTPSEWLELRRYENKI